MKAKLKYLDNGQCVGCLVDTSDPSFVEADVQSMSAMDNHKEPYRSQYLFLAIKKKTQELLDKRYIFGLSNGYQKDEEYKKWCEEVIDFCNSFEGETIPKGEVAFPTDPWGHQEVLEL